MQIQFGVARSTGPTIVVLAAFTTLLLPIVSVAHTHAQEGHGEPLHFAHPLFAESPSPDTKIRTDYIFGKSAGKDAVQTHTARLEAEYAPRPWFSLEMDLPLTVRNPDASGSTNHLDTVTLALKLASLALAERGVLLGGGIEFGFPTGNHRKGIGSSEVFEVQPFVDFGWGHQDLELIAFFSSAIATHRSGEDVANVNLGWNLSFLYHVDDNVEALLELSGERMLGGAESGNSIVSISPGLKFAPSDDPNLKVGVGVGLPIGKNKEFDVRTIVSVFYHF